MKMWHFAPVVVAILGAAVIFSSGGSDDQKPAPTPPVYAVETYDVKRDPETDLKAAAVKAQAENRVILMQVGGDWCGWCHLLDRYFRTNDKVAALLSKHYLILKVNYSDENSNEAFLAKYPEIQAFPHLFVLDASGKLLHSQDTGEFEFGRSYQESALTKFLETWAPRPVSNQP